MSSARTLAATSNHGEPEGICTQVKCRDSWESKTHALHNELHAMCANSINTGEWRPTKIFKASLQTL